MKYKQGALLEATFAPWGQHPIALKSHLPNRAPWLSNEGRLHFLSARDFFPLLVQHWCCGCCIYRCSRGVYGRRKELEDAASLHWSGFISGEIFGRPAHLYLFQFCNHVSRLISLAVFLNMGHTYGGGITRIGRRGFRVLIITCRCLSVSTPPFGFPRPDMYARLCSGWMDTSQPFSLW